MEPSDMDEVARDVLEMLDPAVEASAIIRKWRSRLTPPPAPEPVTAWVVQLYEKAPYATHGATPHSLKIRYEISPDHKTCGPITAINGEPVLVGRDAVTARKARELAEAGWMIRKSLVEGQVKYLWWCDGESIARDDAPTYPAAVRAAHAAMKGGGDGE